MVLFIILTLTVILLAILLVVGVSVLGAGAVVLFGDVIVCVVFLVLIMRYFIKKRGGS